MKGEEGDIGVGGGDEKAADKQSPLYKKETKRIENNIVETTVFE